MLYIEHKTRQWVVVIEPSDIASISVDDESYRDWDAASPETPKADVPRVERYSVNVAMDGREYYHLEVDSQEEATTLYDRLRRAMEAARRPLNTEEILTLGETPE